MILIKWILLIAIVISGQCKVEIIKSVSLKEAMAKNNITYREVTPTSIIVANIALKVLIIFIFYTIKFINFSKLSLAVSTKSALFFIFVTMANQ